MNEEMPKTECSRMRFALLFAAILLSVPGGSFVSTVQAAELEPWSIAPYSDECSDCHCPGVEPTPLVHTVRGEYELSVFSTTLLGDTLLTLPALLNTDRTEPSWGGGRSNDVLGMRNPATVYCEALGYEYRIEETAEGQRGICTMPTGEALDEWRFYKGEVGQQFSYCARRGWATSSHGNADSISSECTTCVLPDGTRKTVSELLNLSEKSHVGVLKSDEGPLVGATARDEDLNSTITQSSLPLFFDWRNFDGQNWMTRVKNQGLCGSCWAFSAVGIVEPIYNIATGNPDLDLDLSEQYLVADCLSDETCCGGWHGTALNFMQDSGIPDEACLPYVDFNCSYTYIGQHCYCDCTYICSNTQCSDRCADWADRLEYIDDCDSVSADQEMIKHYLIENGPLAVALDMRGTFENGVYECDAPTQLTHAVVLVGYDDVGGYWIAKNSWGSSWNGNGYFNIGYGQCGIESAVYYATLSETVPPTVEILSPDNGTWFDAEPVIVTFYPWDNSAGSLNYKIFVDRTEIANGTATSGVNWTVNLDILPECQHMIRVNVTDDMGLSASDAITVHVDLTAPTVEILEPANDSWFDSENVTVTFLPCDNKAATLNYSIVVNGVEKANGAAANGTNKTVNLGVLPDECDNIIRINVTDYVGKMNSREVTVWVDLTPPIVQLQLPGEGGIYGKVCVPLNFSGHDTGACPSGFDAQSSYYVLDGGAPVNISGNDTIGNLAACGHTLVLYVKDNVGTVNSTTVNFTLHPADVSGDDKVNIFDLQQLAWAFLSLPGYPNWNPAADLNCDSVVNVLDLQILAWHFMKSYK